MFGTPPFYYGRRDAKPKPSESLLKVFTLVCGQCKSERVVGMAEPDDDAGVVVFLFCKACQAREKLPLS